MRKQKNDRGVSIHRKWAITVAERTVYTSRSRLCTRDEFIDAMYRRVFAAHGSPLTTVNDRGGQMTATLSKRLCARYGIKIKVLVSTPPRDR